MQTHAARHLNMNVLEDPGPQLHFPDEYSIFRPKLVHFGHEPEVTPPWVTVGKHASVERSVQIILGGQHRPEWVSTFPFRAVLGLPGAREDGIPTTKGPIHIGEDAWVGYEAMLTPGVTIGVGAVVATRSLKVKDVEPYEIVGGNPARHIRYRFDLETRQALLRIRWWEWPDDEVRAAIDELCSDDLTGFIARHDPGTH